jgi:phenylalanyl-tRNA synthetase beta chain
MLCSASELGLEESSAGIIELQGQPTPGTTAINHFQLDDNIIDLELTPNRGDCLSMRGVAREVAALTAAKLKTPVKLVDVEAQHKSKLPVSLEATDACPRYLGRILQGVDVQAETPLWMRERLRRAGVRSLGPCVDVTNYVMIELGQPMHAFDLDKLDKGIVVRYANGREKVELLDGTVVKPKKTDLLIADHSGPLALAGVMGGSASAVTDDTTDILLESAFFTPEVIAVTSRDRGIHSDSSHRFERGVDFELQRVAIERATELLIEIAGGSPGPVIENTAKKDIPVRAPVSLRSSYLSRLLGVTIPSAKISSSLKRLGMQVDAKAEKFSVTPPSYRFDISLEADLIEEVARLTGFDQIPEVPPVVRMQISAGKEEILPVRKLEQVLVDRGFNEVVTYSFIDRGMHDLLSPHHEPLELINPISADMSIMRTTLWPGLLTSVQYNFNRQMRNLRLFESGRTFIRKGRKIVQDTYVGGLITGNVEERHWQTSAREVDFYDMKGHVEALLALTGRSEEFSYEAISHSSLHPGQSALILDGADPVGMIGRLHPGIESKLNLGQAVYLFEIEQAALQKSAIPVFTPVSRYPAIQRDIALIIDQKIAASDVFKQIVKSAGSLLVNLELFDQYHGEHVDFGKKSLAYTLTLQHSSRTLRDEEVENVMHRVLEQLKEGLGAQLR